MPLQVIGGEARGRRLKSPPAGVRPTAAIVRRSLFDTLGYLVSDAAVLDLYAGAGTLGIEALSRGARGCDFVERDRGCCGVIRANLAALGTAAGGPNGRVHCAPAEKWLRNSARGEGEYDLVFADPPYGEPGLNRVLSMLVETGGLSADAVIALETRRGAGLEMPDGLAEARRIRHGDSQLILLRPIG
jgi:16S rRNA (guanine966-N2)-methyltransferase